jgi:hypothetical protein
MRTPLILIAIVLGASESVHAQASCSVSGYLFNTDGSPNALGQASVISVVSDGSSFVLTPMTLTTDASGFTIFTVPRKSTVWIAGAALGLFATGDVGILIPDEATASLEVLRQSARPPVSGVSLTTGDSPSLAIWLRDFGINLRAPLNGRARTGPAHTQDSWSPPVVESFNGRSGVVRLTSSDVTAALTYTPLDPGNVIGAVNASSDQIDSARLSADVVRRNIANMFSAPQTFSKGLQVSGSAQTLVATSDTDMMQFFRWNPPAGWELGARVNSQGALYTNAWMTISGTGNAFTHPSADPFMLGIWSDVDSTAMQVRGSGLGNSSLFSGLNGAGDYTFSLEEDGTLLWGASNTRASLLADGTNLRRLAPATLMTDSTFLVRGNVGIGTTTPSEKLDVNGGIHTSGNVSGDVFTTDPSPPPPGEWKLYAIDDGTGSPQLCVLFATGPPQCFAKQP